VRDLPLQVGEIDVVMIAQRQAADARSGEVQRDRRAQPARADDQCMRREQPLLPLDADLGEQDVSAVAQQLLVVEVDVGFQRSVLGCQRAQRCRRPGAAEHSSMQDARNGARGQRHRLP
jgi:hypothetical protein